MEKRKYRLVKKTDLLSKSTYYIILKHHKFLKFEWETTWHPPEPHIGIYYEKDIDFAKRICNNLNEGKPLYYIDDPES